MAGAKEINTKIKSIQNTSKVTRALEMVSASKIRKAQARMRSSRPYAEKMRNVIGHLAHANAEYKHPYLIDRDVNRIGVILISSDRGQCGGLNNNLFKKTLSVLSEWHDKDVEADLVTIGNKGHQFFKNIKINMLAHASGVSEEPKVADLIGIIKTMLDAFQENKIDRIYLANNQFVNTMVQKPVVDQLLPLLPIEDTEIKKHWDYIYEPDAKEVLDQILMRYIESLVYQAVLENLACEHAARMIAMKNATDNAKQLIDDLKLVYNKARQAAITQELAEIVGGAAAV